MDWQHVVNIFDFRLLLHEAPSDAKKLPNKYEAHRPDVKRTNSIDPPGGGRAATSPIWSMNVGGLPCIKGLHVQDSILGINVGELSCI